MFISKSLIVLVILVISTYSQPENSVVDDFLTTQEFEDYCKEYLRLDLVNDLSLAKEKTFTSNGRKWLIAWKDRKILILKNILYFHNSMNNQFQIHPNWPVRVKKFEEIKDNYYQSILLHPINPETSPWPIITFNHLTGATHVHFDKTLKSIENFNEDDPIVSKKLIDELYAVYRPFTQEERQINQKAEEAQKDLFDVEKNPSKRLYSDEIDGYEHTISEFKYYRDLIKKYYIIDREKIENLVSARYLLSKKSLENKRLSNWHYRKATLQAKRVMNEIKLWDKYCDNLNVAKYNFMDKIPRHLRMLENDKNYRKYLNADDDFFRGNVLYGMKNRYDDPIRQKLINDYGFEITAEGIIGSTYDHMHELFVDIRDFEHASKLRDQLELRDLPVIEFLLERFETWTFWYNQVKFSHKEWFKARIPAFETEMHAIVPINSKSENPHERLRETMKMLNKARAVPYGSDFDTNDETMVLRFKKKLFQDYQVIKKTTTLLKSQNILFSQNINFLESLRNADRLSLLTTSLTNTEVSSHTHRRQIPIVITLDQDDKANRDKKFVKSQIEMITNDLHDTFNFEKKVLVHVSNDKLLKISEKDTTGHSGIHIHNYGTGGDVSNQHRDNILSTNFKDSGGKSNIKIKHH